MEKSGYQIVTSPEDTGHSNDWLDERNAELILPATLEAASNFVRRYADYLSKMNIHIQAPEIDPCPDGTIDLNWHTSQARMLVNIRPENNQYLAFYFGDLYCNKSPIKGNVEVNIFSEFLAVWMKYLA